MTVEKVTEIKKNDELTFDDVKKQVEDEIRKERLDKFSSKYKALLRQLENAKLVVRNIEREIRETEEESGE